MNGKDQSFKCEQCPFTTTSISHMKKHKENIHKEKDIEIEMRPRYNCDKCAFKTTSECVLQKHMSMHHDNMKKIASSKRKTCKDCGKQFNKEETFMKHAKTTHKNTV